MSDDLHNLHRLPNAADAAERRKVRENRELLAEFKSARHAWMEETDPFAKKALFARFRDLAANCEARKMDMRA